MAEWCWEITYLGLILHIFTVYYVQLFSNLYFNLTNKLDFYRFCAWWSATARQSPVKKTSTSHSNIQRMTPWCISVYLCLCFLSFLSVVFFSLFFKKQILFIFINCIPSELRFAKILFKCNIFKIISNYEHQMIILVARLDIV